MPLFSYAIIALLLQYLQAQQRDEFYLFLLPSLFFIALLLFIVLFFRNMQRSQENAKVSAVLNTQLEHFGAQYEELEESMQLFRERSHDWKNHLLVIQSLSNSDDTTKLREYISKVTGADDVMLKMYTGHPAIDVILTALKRKAERTRIDVDISARLAKEIDISQADICVLVSNAVDNAYEACERTTKGDRRIDIKIVTDEVYFVFIISNTMQEPPKQSRGKFLTSKADNVMHGIGLQSIKRIADKHFGHVTIATDNDVFTLNCALKNKKVTD
ncbi:MAG: GHKL domain-containing protein [Oscillospiraceae bacterium]|nr:GHKL domain-containing protein [Oscillospiraceae bacterium]